MESFLESLQQACTSPDSGRDVNFGLLHSALRDAATPDGIKEALYALIDQYGSDDANLHLRIGVTKAIGIVLAFASSLAHPDTAAEVLALEDVLMAAMFFNELSTVAAPALFVEYAAAVAHFYPLALPTAYAAEDDAETRASAKAELVALRQSIANRLDGTGPSAAPSTSSASPEMAHRVSRAALSCLAVMMRTQSRTLHRPSAAAHAAVLCGELQETIDGLMGPLVTALQEQQQQQQQQGPGQMNAMGQHGGRAGETAVTATLLTSVMASLEEALWSAESLVEGPTSHAAAALAPAAAGVFQHSTSTLLGHLQRYLALQQQRQTDAGAGPAGGFGGRPDRLQDVLRVYSAQRAVQRVLSVATVAASAQAARRQKDSGAEAEAVRLLTATLGSALQAALSAFGGIVAVTRPAPRQWGAVDARAAQSWETPDDRARPSTNLLASVMGAADDVDFDGEGAPGAGDDAMFLGDADGLMHHHHPGGGKELLRSSVGLVSAAALVEMVMSSVAAMPREQLTMERLRRRHLSGLNEMQHQAARRAQRAELERQRAVERQGVEAIPATKLLDHVRDSSNVHAKGMATLRRVSTRAVLERAAFRSVLQSYGQLSEESEATVRAAQALIGRCLVQLPHSMFDAALDEVLVLLQAELRRERKLREGNSSGEATANSLVAKTHSHYQLVLQVLFSFAAAQAPIAERGEVNPLLLFNDHGAMAAGIGGATAAAAGGPSAHLTSHVTLSVNTDNPIAFLHEDSARTPSYLTAAELGASRKRARLEAAGEGRDAYGRSDDDDDDLGDGAGDSGTDFFFLNDTARSPCPYSHVLCRVVELVDECKLDALVVDVLLQAPTLTRYVWSYIYRRFCLSTVSQERCDMGFRLLSELATRRPVYRTCAVNMLLSLCVSKSDYARRVAINSVGLLMNASGADRRPVITPDAESALVRYAKMQLAAIPSYQFTTVLRASQENSGVAALSEDAIAALQKEVDQNAQDVLGRHLHLFLKLCARQPRGLFPALLDVYAQCVGRNSEVVVRLLRGNEDVHAMVNLLLATDPAGFMTSVAPSLRRYSAEASLFVQSLLGTIGARLRAMGRGGKAVAPSVVRQVASGLLAFATAMYDMSHIPLGGSGADHNDDGGNGMGHRGMGGAGEEGGAFVLHDIRFMAPFLSLVPRTELKERYLPAFLYFVQVQLQFQRFYTRHHQQQQQHHYHHHDGGEDDMGAGGAGNASTAIALLSAQERGYVMTPEELRHFIATVTREVLEKTTVQHDDGVNRGLSPVEFFVYLHRCSQDETLAEKGYPPIGVLTTKEVIGVCLGLTRAFSFDTTTDIPKLYGPEEVQRAIKRIMNPPPVPSQLMVTVLSAVGTIYPRGTRYNVVKEFLSFVLMNVLVPLERARVWETDVQLWKGVLLFVRKFYLDCKGFLDNLPDQVLIQALRENPELTVKFKEEHGNNASFGRILSSI